MEIYSNFNLMRILYILLFLSLNLVSACKKDSGEQTLGIDIQSSFNQNKVQVFIDGQELLNRRLQTNWVLGVCAVDGQISTTKTEGRHEIKVIVNDRVTKTENFSLHNALYIGVIYNPQTNEISFVYSGKQFIYD